MRSLFAHLLLSPYLRVELEAEGGEGAKQPLTHRILLAGAGRSASGAEARARVDATLDRLHKWFGQLV